MCSTMAFSGAVDGIQDVGGASELQGENCRAFLGPTKAYIQEVSSALEHHELDGGAMGCERVGQETGWGSRVEMELG